MPVLSFVGVVAEVKRQRANDYHCLRCTVYGIDEREFAALRAAGIEARPRHFEPSAERFVLLCSAWRAMRALGDAFGYHLPANVPHERVDGPSGERRVCIFTLATVREGQDLGSDAKSR